MTAPEKDTDSVVEQLASGNPGLLARLLALQGLSELDVTEQQIVADAHAALEQVLKTDDIPEEVAVWQQAEGFPPMPEDFTPGERWYIEDYSRISPFLGLVKGCLPGIQVLGTRDIVNIPPNKYL